MCETVMIATKIRVTRSSMQTYWYAGKIGEEFWVTKNSENTYELVDHHPGRWIGVEDCEAVRIGKIKVITVVEELE